VTARRGVLWLVAGLALTLLGGRWLAALYGDWAFHHALGSDAVWRAGLITTAVLRAAIFAVTFAFVFANLFAVRQSIVSLVLPRQVGNLEFGEAIPTRRLTLVALGGAGLIALALMLVDIDWTVARLAFSGTPFAEFDPYLERDLGFFVYWLPFERLWNQLVGALVLLTVVLVLALYALTPSIRWDERGLYVSTWVRRHLGLLGSVVILLVSWNWRLDRLTLLTEGGTTTSWVEAPSYFSAYDHRVLMPYLVIVAFAALPAAVVFGWSVWRGHLRVAFGLVSALLVAGPVMRLILPAVAAGEGTVREATARERPYLAARTLYSRRAFGVDAIARPETLSLSVLDSARVARRVSTWDAAALVRFLELERRGTDVAAFAWQGGPGGLEAVLLREAPPATPAPGLWPEDRLQAAAADEAGAPLATGGLLMRGVAGVLVHPGASRFAIVADSAGRLAAPPFEGTFERFAHAWDQQTPRLFFGEPPAVRPRIVVRRDVRERLAAVAPFFVAGPTVAPLVRNDSLYWITELFTVSRDYPLAERLPFEGVTAHYVQHAATAVVQAQTGRVMLVPITDPDPVTRSWMRIFPELFTAREAVPAWMRTALPPAIDWASVQGTILGRTGLLVDTLATRTLARVDDADADLALGPSPLFQLDDAGTLGWSVAVVDREDRITGLLVARGGMDPRTELHPVAAGPRWTATLEQLQAAADSGGFGRSMPHARRGRVQATPLTNGVLFSQAFYEWPPDGPPRLAGVALLLNDRARTGRTLAAALGLPEDAAGRALPAAVFRMRVAALYDAMAAALRAGDWRAYGDAWAALGRLLGRPVP
jgi:hypothetical protein